VLIVASHSHYDATRVACSISALRFYDRKALADEETREREGEEEEDEGEGGSGGHRRCGERPVAPIDGAGARTLQKFDPSSSRSYSVASSETLVIAGFVWNDLRSVVVLR